MYIAAFRIWVLTSIATNESNFSKGYSLKSNACKYSPLRSSFDSTFFLGRLPETEKKFILRLVVININQNQQEEDCVILLSLHIQ